jgi:integrase
VLKLHRKIGKSKKVTANRVVETLSSVFRFAFQSGVLPKSHGNPASDIEAFKEQGRERFLTSVELARLGDALRLAETEGLPWAFPAGEAPERLPRDVTKHRTICSEHVTNAIRLLLFTGARLREVLHLKWQQWDRERDLLFLSDSKTGKRTIVLNAAALTVLLELEQIRIGHFVIAGANAGTDREKPRADIKRTWERVSDYAGLAGVRLHDLRHTHASFGVGDGLGLPIIGKLLGHRSVATTARYAHLDNDPLRRASKIIGSKLSAAMHAEIPTMAPHKNTDEAF